MSTIDLEWELARCDKALGNKKLLPQSVTYYRRRREMVAAKMRVHGEYVAPKREG